MSDYISRQAAIDAIEEMQMPIMRSEFPEEQFVFTGMSEALRAIKDLPSAQSEPIKINIDHELTKEEYEKLRKDLADAPIVLMPSAQPEIIRCKDCKHQEKFFKKDGRRKDGGYYIYGCYLAEEYSHVCLDDDYCSRAERKEGKHETD